MAYLLVAHGPSEGIGPGPRDTSVPGSFRVLPIAHVTVVVSLAPPVGRPLLDASRPYSTVSPVTPRIRRELVPRSRPNQCPLVLLSTPPLFPFRPLYFMYVVFGGDGLRGWTRVSVVTVRDYENREEDVGDGKILAP